jgi:hypothetical protein
MGLQKQRSQVPEYKELQREDSVRETEALVKVISVIARPALKADNLTAICDPIF